MTRTSLLLAVGLAMLCAACASTGVKPRPFPTVGDERRDSDHDLSDRQAVVQTALALRGVAYRDGGSDARGFDCSGFTQYVFGKHGIELPRAVREQYREGRSIPLAGVQPGDLIFFSTIAPGASHVAIAIGGDAFIHAPSTAGVVRVEHLGERYWSRRLVGVRRLAAAD